jgi:nitrite reductase/ring-hydroxylating ferredoxin subunit
LGVATFTTALVHAVLVLVWYHGFGVLHPLVSMLASNPRYDTLAGFPFEALGFVALLILLLMAATSHDFWNATLGARSWKALHRAVHVAHGLLVAHVALGALQSEDHPGYPIILGVAVALVAGLQVYTALCASGRLTDTVAAGAWLRVGALQDIPDGRAVVVQPPGGERIAVFRHQGRVSAVSNVCKHQGGPLGEGRVIDGCITCPWHGYQYRPEDGCAPPPFTERIATYRTRVQRGVVFVDPAALPPGTFVPPGTAHTA